MDMHDYTALGAAVLSGNPAFVRPLNRESLHARKASDNLKNLASYAVPANQNAHIDGRVEVGFTTPALTFDKQRQINGSALSLNFDIERNITDQHPNGAQFRKSWDTWFATWQHFFERYQTNGGKFSALLDSDAVAEQTESFRVQLANWVVAYEAEGTSEHPVTPTSAAPVPKQEKAGSEPDDKKAEGVPWWLITMFIVGGVSVVAGSFFLIRRKVIQGKVAEHFIKRDVLPIALGSTLGPTGVAFAHAATNRFAGPANDPSGLGGPTPVGYERVYVVG